MSQTRVVVVVRGGFVSEILTDDRRNLSLLIVDLDTLSHAAGPRVSLGGVPAAFESPALSYAPERVSSIFEEALG